MRQRQHGQDEERRVGKCLGVTVVGPVDLLAAQDPLGGLHVDGQFARLALQRHDGRHRRGDQEQDRDRAFSQVESQTPVHVPALACRGNIPQRAHTCNSSREGLDDP